MLQNVLTKFSRVIVLPLQSAWGMFLDIAFPVFCLGCGSEGSWLCPACEKGIVCVPPQCFVCHALSPACRNAPAGRTCRQCRKKTAVYGFLSPWRMQDPVVRSLIHRFKYSRVALLGEVSASVLARYLGYQCISFPANSLAIPLPLHPRRRRNRGFNQAERIAYHLSQHLSIPLASDILVRVKYTRPQAELSRPNRQTNMQDAFGLLRPMMLTGKTVLLIDDVKTTGATLDSAARVLKKGGARRVIAITLAH